MSHKGPPPSPIRIDIDNDDDEEIHADNEAEDRSETKIFPSETFKSMSVNT